MSISTNKSSPYYGPLKGEIELANGSKILFNAADWTFSHIPIDGCMLKAKETTRPFIMTWDPAKGDCFTAWKVSKDEYGRSPIVDLVQQEELKSRIVHREMLLEDARKLLERYAETFPWEYELKGIKDHLVERIDNLKKETAKKQEESTALFDVVSKTIHNFPNACNVTAQSDKEKIMATYYTDTHTWELKVWRLQGASIPIGKTKLKTELQAMANKHNIDLTKGWKVVNHQYKY